MPSARWMTWSCSRAQSNSTRPRTRSSRTSVPVVGIFSRTTACRPCGLEPGPLGGRFGHEPPAVEERPLLALGRLAFGLKFLGRGIIVVGMAAGQQFLDRGLVAVQPLRLVIGGERPAHFRPLVPVDAQPAQAVEDRLQGLLDVPLLVGVVDPQDELPAVLPGEEPIEKRGADSADVEVSGGAGGESGADGHSGQWLVVSGRWTRRLRPNGDVNHSTEHSHRVKMCPTNKRGYPLTDH